MGQFKVAEKAEAIAPKLLQLCADEGLTFAEVADVPNVMETLIRREVRNLKADTFFRCYGNNS